MPAWVHCDSSEDVRRVDLGVQRTLLEPGFGFLVEKAEVGALGRRLPERLRNACMGSL